jgi:hypothetical protein
MVSGLAAGGSRKKPNRISRGTRSSNPVPSSRRSASRPNSPPFLEKPAVSAGVRGRVGRRGRQRRAGADNIAAKSGNISVGPYSSTAVRPMPFATVAAPVASEVGLPRLGDVGRALSSERLKQSRARPAARARQAADVSAPAACLRSGRAAGARREWPG